MNRKSFFRAIAFCLLSATVISGCKKEVVGPDGAQGPAGPALTGTVNGHIYLYDQYGNPILTGLVGIHDSIDGTSNVAHTDSTGMYVFSNLSTGIYNFTVMDSAFGTMKVQSQQFVGGGTLVRNINLSKIPSFNVSSLTAVASATNITLTGTVTADTHVRTFIVFVGATNAASASPSTYLDYYTKNVPANGTSFTINVDNTALYNLGLTTTTTAYFAAYGAASGYNSTSTYEDLTTGRTVFNAISPTFASANAVVQ